MPRSTRLKEPADKLGAGRLSPEVHFLLAAQGTIPETIKESDLATLNAGVAILLDRLREAKRLYDEGRDGERKAAFTALGGLWQFAELFAPVHAEILRVPAVKLMDALQSLDNNLVLPMVAPTKRRGRAPSSQADMALTGHVAGTVKRLQDTGLGLLESQKLVASELTKLGVRPERGNGEITRNTVRHWCEKVDEDVGRQGAAAQIYDSMFTAEENERFQTLQPAVARRFALASMRYYVSTINPERLPRE
jgi:hypothetical protein